MTLHDVALVGCRECWAEEDHVQDGHHSLGVLSRGADFPMHWLGQEGLQTGNREEVVGLLGRGRLPIFCWLWVGGGSSR